MAKLPDHRAIFAHSETFCTENLPCDCVKMNDPNNAKNLGFHLIISTAAETSESRFGLPRHIITSHPEEKRAWHWTAKLWQGNMCVIY